jgi:restriction system protein
MQDESSSSAALVAQWRELRGIVSAVGSSVGSSDAIAVSGAIVSAVGSSVSLEGGAHVIALGSAELTVNAPAATVVVQPPELMLGVSLVVPGDRTDEGVIIRAVTPVWRRFLSELANSPTALSRLDWRQTEELVAGAYREEGWTVTLTPRSRDKGRDIIAHRDDIGAIRVLDQVKQYAPGHTVDAGEVREIFGTLNLDPKASKAVITTTSRFAPGVFVDFASVMPTRLELRDGSQLRLWLQRFLEKA